MTFNRRIDHQVATASGGAQRYRLIVPDKVLVNDGVCVPVSMLATLKVPLNFNEPLAPANLPVPPVILATPLSVAVPAPLGTVADELTTNSASVLPDPERVPLPLKLNPVFVAVVGTWPAPLKALKPRLLPVPVPLSDVTVADPDVELFTMSKVKVPEYEPLNTTFLDADAVVVVVRFVVVVVVCFGFVVVVAPAFVVVVDLTDGARKAIGAAAVSPPLALPALMAQFFRFDGVVPQAPLPIVPVTTLNAVLGSTPAAVIVTGVAVAVSHPPCPLAVTRHSTRNTWSFGVKLVPDTFTVAPFVRPADGRMIRAGGTTIEAIGVTLCEGEELELVPTLFFATTVNVYVVPFVNPDTVHVVPEVVQVLLDGFDVATYEVIAAPPSEEGADQLTTADDLAATADTAWGAAGLDAPLLPEATTKTTATTTTTAKTEIKTAGRVQNFPLILLNPSLSPRVRSNTEASLHVIGSSTMAWTQRRANGAKTVLSRGRELDLSWCDWRRRAAVQRRLQSDRRGYWRG